MELAGPLFGGLPTCPASIRNLGRRNVTSGPNSRPIHDSDIWQFSSLSFISIRISLEQTLGSRESESLARSKKEDRSKLEKRWGRPNALPPGFVRRGPCTNTSAGEVMLLTIY